MNKLKNKNIWVCLYITENMYNDLIKYIDKCKIIIKFKTSNVRTDCIYCWN
jgi:hypothetical protein